MSASIEDLGGIEPLTVAVVHQPAEPGAASSAMTSTAAARIFMVQAEILDDL